MVILFKKIKTMKELKSLEEIEFYTNEELEFVNNIVNNEILRRINDKEKQKEEEWKAAGLYNCDQCGKQLAGRMELMVGLCEDCV